MTWQTTRGGGRKTHKKSASYRARQISAEVTFRRSPWRGATAGWPNSSFLELCRVCEKQNYQTVHKIHLFFPKKRPLKKQTKTHTAVPPLICYVPDLCHRLAAGPGPVSSVCSAGGSVWRSRGIRLHLGNKRHQRGRERERRGGERGSVDAQRGTRGWEVGFAQKIQLNAHKRITLGRRRGGWRVRPVANSERWFSHFLHPAAPLKKKKKKKKDVTHVFLHLISIFHPLMSQSECSVLVQAPAYWRYLTYFIL